MPLFQESIVRKYLSTLDPEVLEAAFEIFKKVYSPSKIQNIRILKEEQYQEGFIKDVFGSVLGYSVFPEENYNIETEKKNEADAKKADGAILKDDKVIGVIELKDNKTKNLDSVKDQVFGYKNNHKDCSYVISSNFHKLRFYVDDATEYEEFDLYNLDKETFRRFYLYLRKEGLLDKNIPKLLRQETKFHEENITKNLYRDYSQFKNNFFQNAVKNNPQFDKLTLFKKSQRFLDKLLFVLFAEDKGIVTTNSVVRIVEKWNDLKNDAFDNPKPLFQLVSLFFNNLYTGKKDQQGNVLVPEFGGELFAPDPVLDILVIDDDVLSNDLLRLSKYDYNTEVDVNILGHIFEHSLNEIEEVEAELRGEEHDKSKGKRKKEGIFYTPKYITKYIVNSTLGKLCQEKKKELGIENFAEPSEYLRADGKLSEKGKGLYERLNNYKLWLFGLKILDPACGSGAFLNEAVNFLIDDHKYIDDVIAELTNTPLRLFDTDFTILENNIYGVDINEESVEIAKLSLWLRTARPNRKLNNLSNNIKCGNSLIDDPAVAGDKAFNWQKEFPQVFEKGGFDVVIGNPPYGADLTEKEKKFYKQVFPISSQGKIDTYKLFLEKVFNLVKQDGYISLITPNTFLYNIQSQKLRELIFKNFVITDAIELRKNIFVDAPDVVTVILTLVNRFNSEYYFRCRVAYPNYVYNDLHNDKFEIDQIIPISFLLNDSTKKINLRSNFGFYSIKRKLKEFSKIDNHYYLKQGTKPYGVKDLKSEILVGYEKIDEHWEKAINGRNIGRYKIEFENYFVKRSEKLHSCLSKEIVFGEKIYFQRMRKISLFPRLVASYDNEDYHGLYTCSVIYKKDESQPSLKFLLCLLNSSLLNIWYKYFDTDIEIKLASVKEIPFVDITPDRQAHFIEKADLMLSLNKQLQEVSVSFQHTVQRRFVLEDLSAKLQSWYHLTYAEFIKELKKKKIKLTLSEEAEWESYFNQESSKALALKQSIQATDQEIDQMVYALYGLTDDEIRIVEGLS